MMCISDYQSHSSLHWNETLIDTQFENMYIHIYVWYMYMYITFANIIDTRHQSVCVCVCVCFYHLPLIAYWGRKYRLGTVSEVKLSWIHLGTNKAAACFSMMFFYPERTRNCASYMYLSLCEMHLIYIECFPFCVSFDNLLSWQLVVRRVYNSFVQFFT